MYQSAGTLRRNTYMSHYTLTVEKESSQQLHAILQLVVSMVASASQRSTSRLMQAAHLVLAAVKLRPQVHQEGADGEKGQERPLAPGPVQLAHCSSLVKVWRDDRILISA